MFTLFFIILFVAAGLRIANHYPTRLKLAYDENAISNGQYYRLFTAIFDNQNWIGVLFAALNLFFLIASIEKQMGIFITISIIMILSILPYYINYKSNSSTDYFWGSLPLIFGLFIFQTCIDPFAEIRVLFILPLNFIIFTAIIIGLIIYNEIKNKIPLSSLSIAFVGYAAIILSAIFSFDQIIQNWYIVLAIAIGLSAIVALNKNWFSKKSPKAKVIKMNPDHYFNIKKISDQERVNELLDKINKQGIHSLNKEEKQFLEDFSKK